MAASSGSRILRPLLYISGATAVGGTFLYVAYRPRDIPGLEPAQVPPPTYGEGGNFRLPNFPRTPSRDEQIAALKRSSGTITTAGPDLKKTITGWFTRVKGNREAKETGQETPYDLLIIGAGATGSGIALDAATRGLKVAVVERDDFSSGTSSKSTKLVHGGVRYLEKAFWELDYNQSVSPDDIFQSVQILIFFQIQASQGGFERAKILSRHSTAFVFMVAHYDSDQQLVASTLFLGRYKTV
jgi:glycerol-3-phosphate dehydrogenase